MATTTSSFDDCNSNKRMRHSSGVSSSSTPLNQLPDVLLAQVATYLTKTPCAFFAAAMTASSSSWQKCNWQQRRPSAASKAIVSNVGPDQWEGLDFMDIDKSCRTKLTDGEIVGVLVCIDAVNKVRSLKLTHCFKIIGTGLEPLRESAALERIDLSLVDQHENPQIEPTPAIDVGTAIPILRGIIETDGNSLHHVQLPKKWRREQGCVLDQFLSRYEQSLNERNIHCYSKRCGQSCEGNPWVLSYQDSRNDLYGMQYRTCYQCLRHVCIECSSRYVRPEFCRYSEKYFCSSCINVENCKGDDCYGSSCVVCKCA
mmetsp:Transcript_7564/g.16468  ORF Transcript_7564/g.16468 Transcript_7564/m.16468 type:complete len:314 (+) Transcript_7564:85-1026(+)